MICPLGGAWGTVIIGDLLLDVPQFYGKARLFAFSTTLRTCSACAIDDHMPVSRGALHGTSFLGMGAITPGGGVVKGCEFLCPFLGMGNHAPPPPSEWAIIPPLS